MATAFNWRDAWDEVDAEGEPFDGLDCYDLPTDNGRTRIYEGDRFWDAEEHHILTVTDVMTKIYRGVVGPKGEEGNDNVFFERDWTPHRPPHQRSHPSDDGPFFMSVESFAERLDEGSLVAHRGNGIRPIP